MTRDLVDADLAAQPGLTGALMKAADSMAKAFAEAADTLREVAWAVDMERRGRLSAPMRQDWSEVASSIEQLMRGELLDDERRKWLADRVRIALPPVQQEPEPEPAAAPAAEARGFLVWGRERAERQGGAS